MTDPRDLPDADTLRARGWLKWTGLDGADIAAWVAESDLGTAPEVTAAVTDAVARGLTGYLPPWLRADLQQALAGWAADVWDWRVDPERVRPVGHVTEGLRLALDLVARPGAPVVLPTPAYMPFVTAPELWGRQVLQVPMVRDGDRTVLDLEAVDAAFRAGGHLLVLVNPHNPTGTVARRAELEALADVVDRHGGRVFADEIHAPLVHSPARHVPYASVSPTAAAHTVTATSASKAWNVAGLKCAQLVLTADADLAAWHRATELHEEGASTLGAVANAAAWSAGRAWLADLLAYLDGNRRALAEVLAERAPAVGHVPPEGTYLAWLDLRAALAALPDGERPDGEPLARWLRRRTGVAVTDGALCGAAGAGHVRLNLAMPRPMVVEAGRRIAACLDH